MIFRRRPKTIRNLLVVEDEPLIAFDNEYYLQGEGYKIVATVDRAEDALRALDALEVDAVILDVDLAGNGSGIDVAKKARAIGIAVLFVTGNMPADAAELAEAGLSKPYSHKDLGAALVAIDDLRAGRTPRIPPSVTLFQELA